MVTSLKVRVGDGADKPLANWELVNTGLFVGVVRLLLLLVDDISDGIDDGNVFVSIGTVSDEDKVDDEEAEVVLGCISFWNNLLIFDIMLVAFEFNCSIFVGVWDRDRSSWKEELDDNDIIDWLGLGLLEGFGSSPSSGLSIDLI